MNLSCGAEMFELESSAYFWAEHYSAGNLTCVQVAGLEMPDNPMPKIRLAKSTFPGNHYIVKCVQVSYSQRQLMQTSRTSASRQSQALLAACL